MATVFTKSDPKTPAVRRWMAKLKLAGRWRGVSLRLVASPGTKREAAKRADDLQAELRAGAISGCRAWLGEVTSRKLEAMLGTAVASGDSIITSWRQAYDAYLRACDPKDTRVVVPGKAKCEEKTKISRKYKLRLFVDWAEANRVPFLAAPVTETITSYLEYRRACGIAATTLWSADLTAVVCWAEWMAGRGLCARVDRARVREAMPPRPVPVVSVPAWQDDLSALRWLHRLRLTDSSKGADWKRKRSCYSAWVLVLLSRGLGCRPSEATALTWETVDLRAGRVRFLASKNDRSRVVPILFQWVLDGLTEAWERQGRPTSGPVATKWDGGLWTYDRSASGHIRKLCRHHKRPTYRLKAAEKLHIAHLVRLGFPPHVVAHWTDHTLSVQERHYHEGDGYLPPDEEWDYAEFGTLSAFGRKVKEHVGAYSRALDLD